MRRTSAVVLLFFLLPLVACDASGGAGTARFQDLRLVSPAGTQAGDVPLSVIVFSATATTTRARVEFSTDGGATFQPATAVGEEAKPVFSTRPEGQNNIFVWDSLADISFRNFPDVRLRVRIGSEAFELVATTEPFGLDNTGWLNVFPPRVEDDWELRSVDFATFDRGLAVGVLTRKPRGVLLEFRDRAFAELDLSALSEPFELNRVSDTFFGRLALGRDLLSGQGLLLQSALTGEFVPLTLPFFSLGLELFAADFFAPGRAWICGASGEGLGREGVLLLKDGILRVAPLPVVSTSWELVSVRALGLDAGVAVGTDLAMRRGVALRLVGPLTWEQVELPFVANDWRLNGIDLSAPDEGWAVGEDVRTRRGVILRLEDGSFRVFEDVPEVSADWTLAAVTILPDGTCWAVGEDRIARQGLILRFIDGAWERVEVPRLSRSWDLRSIDFVLQSQGFAVGADKENLRGVILRLDQ